MCSDTVGMFRVDVIFEDRACHREAEITSNRFPPLRQWFGEYGNYSEKKGSKTPPVTFL